MDEFFRRSEQKYILSKEQLNEIKKMLKDVFIEDEHGESTICNLYFDTEQYNLIMNSIDKPKYKDKIRLRSYNIPNLNSNIYLEIKRKYNGVTGKRRIQMNIDDYYEFINNIENQKNNSQVKKELKYYFKLYNLKPSMFLSYDRMAFYYKENRDFRITIDKNILARDFDLEIDKGIYGTRILEEDKYIMEIKTLGVLPMWFVQYLNKLKIYPQSFSKYGEAYKKIILNIKKERKLC